MTFRLRMDSRVTRLMLPTIIMTIIVITLILIGSAILIGMLHRSGIQDLTIIIPDIITVPVASSSSVCRRSFIQLGFLGLVIIITIPIYIDVMIPITMFITRTLFTMAGITIMMDVTMPVEATIIPDRDRIGAGEVIQARQELMATSASHL